MWTLAVIIILVIVVCICLFTKSKIERYGGPIKQTRRIPKDTCYDMCLQYYRKCINDFQYVPSGGYTCQRNYDSCIAMCNYSDFHRL